MINSIEAGDDQYTDEWHKLSRSVDEQLRSAIAGKRLVQLRYSGSVRVVEPHDYGVKNGTAMLLAYQQQTSDPARKSASGWRLFDVAKIAECVVLEMLFKGSRGTSHQHHHSWDILYARVK
jgi:predicted DNA-binding transcriptional regulator YafY